MSASDDLAKWFWRAIESFDRKQHELFLQFAWGRARLPLKAEDFSHHFVLTGVSHQGDSALPSSHTYYLFYLLFLFF